MSDNHLTFSISSDDGKGESPPLKILLHLSTDDDDDQGMNETNTGFVMWPSAVMLAHYLSKNPSVWRGDDRPDGDVMEMGAGCGLAGLAAAALMQNDNNDLSGNGNGDKVVFTDYNPAVLENLRRNILLNEFHLDHEVFGLDWFDQQTSSDSDSHEVAVEKDKNTWVDMEGTVHGQFRLILGTDLIVCSNDADLVATTIDCALMEGGQAIILGPGFDSRFGLGDFPEACRSLGLIVVVDENVLGTHEDATEDDGDQHQLNLMGALELGGHNERSCTHGHNFTMFKIDKPIATT